MSDTPLGNYHFLAWGRRGIGASVNNADNNGSLPSRATLDVQLTLTADSNPVLPPPGMKVNLYGPGDVVGVDPRHVIRTEPRNFTVNYEPNYLAGMEFDQPDFPWLFTPAAANVDRLRPWIVLVVLKSQEFTTPSVAPNPLPVIEVVSLAPLQDLSESWNWVHIQVSGDVLLSQALATTPGAVISRLLCPRRLDPETHYSAFLVPAFEIGRQAGLGNDVSAIATTDPAWTKATAVPLRLPVYYRFEFNTSDEGDFESLVRRLTPRALPAEVGQRFMDVSQPGAHVPSAGDPLKLEGALHSISTKPSEWTGPDKDGFQGFLEDFLDTSTSTIDDPANPNLGDPKVLPPIYGRWHAAVTKVDRTAPGWVNELNLDPRNRSAGGMGTQVVQGERTQLMASAWQQVEGVIRANQLLKQAQLSRAALEQIHSQHLKPAMIETLMYLTAPLHARIMGSPVTIRSLVRSSRVPERMLSATFRRATRPRRRIGLAAAARNQLMTRVNSGEANIVPSPKPPGGMVSIEQISSQLAPSWIRKLPKWWRWALIALLIFLIIVVIVLAASGLWVVALGIAAAVGVAAAILVPRLLKALRQAALASQMTQSGFTPELVSSLPGRPDFHVTEVGAKLPSSAAAGSDSAEAKAFKQATGDLFADLQADPADPPPNPALDLPAMREILLGRLDPKKTVPARMQSLISIGARLRWQPEDPIEPIMAAPEFPQPMYAPLRDLDEQYILPGVELIPPDTMGLLQANHAFIEAYMVGLNHEMARQLLWNDYPNDQRGSYFRQFWDVSAYVPQSGDPSDRDKLRELLKDIPPVHTWPKAQGLGLHENRTDIVADNVVLIGRGELFKRYPNAIIYAGKAKRDDQGKRVLDETDERYPIYRGTLTPDMTFLGFNLSVQDARGGTPQSPEGFFFVFQEQPSEPRFGLEPNAKNVPVTHWADLAWTNFTAGGGSVNLPPLTSTSRGIEISKSPWRMASQVFNFVLGAAKLPDFLSPNVNPKFIAIANDSENPNDSNNTWGVNSAQTAYILLRLPFRILVHADLMMPSQ